MQKLVSVIVPIYHGQMYMPGLIRQLEEAAKETTDYNVELLFVNDDPDMPIGAVPESILTDIRVIQTDKNRGIHGARVRGLSYCRGDFVLFLDQDDTIHKKYLTRQLALIGDADAVVCNVMHDGHMYYDVDRSLEHVITRESMLFEQCMILSPGQVLIRKASISDIWKENIMRVTGADDWLLWICMLCEGKKIVANNEVLFEHKLHYSNTSTDSIRMAESENEVVEIVGRCGLLKGQELEMLAGAAENVQRKRMRDNEKCKRMFRVLSDWMTARENHRYISDYLKTRQLYRVAIYGYGHFGKHLLAELQNEGMKVSYIVDRNARYIDTDIVLKTPEDDLEKVDVFIIAVLKGKNTIAVEQNIQDRVDAKIFWLTDIISEMIS
ncbi:MAG: glycosyltransferase [Kineothrix sp.]|nr:glycosyltransferase [Kineothrix sp.]